MYQPERLTALCPGADPAIVAGVAPTLEDRAGAVLDTPLRRAHFIAQVAHECAGFTQLVENLRYTAARIAVVWPQLAARADELAGNPEALANAAYAGRLGNGQESSGDGWRFRGRGLIQITGKSNYARASLWRDVPLWLMEEPDLAAVPATAALIALGFWVARACNAAADADDLEAVTRLVNGPALAGLDDRRELLAKAKGIFV